MDIFRANCIEKNERTLSFNLGYSGSRLLKIWTIEIIIIGSPFHPMSNLRLGGHLSWLSLDWVYGRLLYLKELVTDNEIFKWLLCYALPVS